MLLGETLDLLGEDDDFDAMPREQLGANPPALEILVGRHEYALCSRTELGDVSVSGVTSSRDLVRKSLTHVHDGEFHQGEGLGHAITQVGVETVGARVVR